MNNYMPKSFDEILIHPKDKQTILDFFTHLIKFNNDPILSKELENLSSGKQTINVQKLRNICVILGAPGSGKSTIIKYLCDKLNMRECHYESESQEHISWVRRTSEDNEQYYHPYNNFLLYSNCQIGNTKKVTRIHEKKQDEHKHVKKNKVCNMLLCQGISSNNKRRKIYENGEKWPLQKVFKTELRNSHPKGRMNKSVPPDIESRVKKKIVEHLVECSELNGKIASLTLKLYNVYVNLVSPTLRAGEKITNPPRCIQDMEFLPPSVVSNQFNKKIRENYMVGINMWKKMNKLLTWVCNLKTLILDKEEEVRTLEKEFIIDMFVDGNHSEYIVNSMQCSSNLSEHINTNAKLSNDIRKSVIDILKLYINLMEEVNEDFALANTLMEELTDFIERKKIRQEIETLMSYGRNYYFFVNGMRRNEMQKGEGNNMPILLNVLKGEKSSPSIINPLESEVKQFIELHRGKEIIPDLVETTNLKRYIGQHERISSELCKREKIIQALTGEEINHIWKHSTLYSNENNGIHDTMAQECHTSTSLLYLMALNGELTHLINNFYILNNIRSLSLCSCFLGNHLTEALIINTILVSYLKGEVASDLIRKNNSPKRVSEESASMMPQIRSKVVGTKLVSTFANTVGHISTNFEEDHHAAYRKLKDILEGKKNPFEDETSPFTIVHNWPQVGGDLPFPEKTQKRVTNYCSEIYKINRRVASKLIKCNHLIEEMITHLGKDKNVKVEMLCALMEDIELKDTTVKWFIPNFLEKQMRRVISGSYLYREFVNIDLKKKWEEEKEKNYYEEHFIGTRAILLDELPLTELEYSEDFRANCASSMEFIFNRINHCKQEYVKYVRENKTTEKFPKCYAIHPMVIFINAYEQIRIVNMLLGIDINNSSHVSFVKLKKIHPLYLEKILAEKYYCRMINMNRNVKEVVRRLVHNCNGDIRSCFNALDLLNRIPNLNEMSLQQINNISLMCQNDIFSFARKVLYRDLGLDTISMDRLSSSTCFNLGTDYATWDTNNKVTYGRIIGNAVASNYSTVATDHVEEAKNQLHKNSLHNSVYTFTSPKKMPLSISGTHQTNRLTMLCDGKTHNKQGKTYMELFTELDGKADMMSTTEKFQVLSLLKENYIFFYNSLADMARLFSNLSVINYSFRGIDCSNFLMRKSHENVNDDVARFVDDHFRLTYRYYMVCNVNPRNPVDNASPVQDGLTKGRNKSAYSSSTHPASTHAASVHTASTCGVAPLCHVNNSFTLKTNSMNKYYHHFSLVRKELYDRYIMIVLRRIANQPVNNSLDVAGRYLFFLRGNYELFASFFPCYIMLIIQHWNSKYECKDTAVQGQNMGTHFVFSPDEPLDNDPFSLNKFCDMVQHFKPCCSWGEKAEAHATEIISFAETFITPKFIALFFPSYLKYLKEGTKQKQIVRNFVGNEAVSTETYFEMRSALRLHDMELHSYFFEY
ncbi:conserved Plasmodium protein, unknown function [Plasmodium knowlesi strain H]|uniref:Uncharacterized protein n=3 Tax=Plasmodium knowlesi TaxID=5850 RepID=A0A5K1U3X5_PLAKH|nr:conserved Plasmodium protein, unknown function [Plasmodium knowlesi strain H]OTN66825.1 Uncharacterized protein PKNOH_S08479900 [Plasmodium knowlesi]CAA9990123.1 conserved Plasmodium protein, unknown function [Plasmodium knowlesi strain H]SBO25804.1 conserved Plasmodium protein, unknown function [Plasmodium knowlesi strain H]SBO28596.1 conserved Plasmodium protein, unknown function [Plasmodium knowlesi strain H]VVS79597.1 conserved Plasmodium protein, unknown function [Plasmodium knowlesi s|eukprot:XP_002260590.1 hypothetical protein, conserved in Plasmodium species [Plasmodium knowlesi strain H]